MTGTWVRLYAGRYNRIGSDGATILAEVFRGDEGWDLRVLPLGESAWSFSRCDCRTLAEAKTIAEVLYKDAVVRLRRGEILTVD